MLRKQLLLEVPNFHKDVLTIGFRNFYKLQRSYSEIIKIRNFDHFSINVESPNKKLAFLSCNPAVSLTLMKSGLLPYDGSVSPTIYRRKDIYIWDKCYVSEYAEKIKQIKEYKFGISKGVVFVRKINEFYIMYSFATKQHGTEFLEDIIEYKEEYLKMGDHCYNLIRPIYAQHLISHDAPLIR